MKTAYNGTQAEQALRFIFYQKQTFVRKNVKKRLQS